MFENFAVTLILAGISGVIISGLSTLGNKEDTTWDWRKYLYTTGIAVISALIVVDGLKTDLTVESNIIPAFIAVVGTSFLGNKLIGIAQKIKNE